MNNEKSTGFFCGRNNGHGIVMEGFEMHSSHVADTATADGMKTIVKVFNEHRELLVALKNYVNAVAVGGGLDQKSIMAAIRKADDEARAAIANAEAK